MIVLLRPAPVIVSSAVPVTLRSPLELSSDPTGAIESRYRPARSTIVFERRLAVPHSVRVPGALRAAIASRSEHFPSCGASSSLVVLTVKWPAGAAAALGSDPETTRLTASALSTQPCRATTVARQSITGDEIRRSTGE
jgi:hypothetical protein